MASVYVCSGLLAPMGKWLAISDRSCTTPQLQPKLEKVFKLAKHPSKDLVGSAEWYYKMTYMILLY